MSCTSCHRSVVLSFRYFDKVEADVSMIDLIVRHLD